jgi:hypothetical protein
MIATRLILNYFSSSDTQVVTRISACMIDISAWISSHHHKFILDKTEMLFLPGKPCLLKDLSITVGKISTENVEFLRQDNTKESIANS